MAIKEITDRIFPEDIEFDMVTVRFKISDSKFERIGHINVHRLGGGLGYLSKVLFVFQAAYFAIRKHYDLYWAMMTYMLFPIVILKMIGNRTPYIVSLQDGDPFTHVFDRVRIKLFKPMLTYGFKKASRVQTISHFLANWAKEAGYSGEVAVIPNGVNLEKFKTRESINKNKEKISLITTSRLVEKNGVGDVIEAMKLLPENIVFKIVGGGLLEHKLMEKVKKLKLEERVEFVGEVKPERIPELLSQADIFIRPSLSEGMGNSFIEALAAGLPIIGTPVGGIPDFLKDGETGLFCQPNHQSSIAQAVKKITDNPELKKNLIKNGLKLAESYDWDLIAKEMESRVFQI